MKPASPVTYLLADDLCITFNAFSDYQVDVDLLKKVRENATVDELISALSVYQGELLPGFYDEWVIIEREHLSSIFEQTMIRLISILQTENRWLDVVNWAERWIKLGQAPEPAYRALMKAHATNGDMAKVAITYKRCTKSLKEYGINPSEKTCTLHSI